MNLKNMIIEDQLDKLAQLTDDVAGSTIGLRHKIRSHESNEDIHVTADQKELWNNKAEAEAVTKAASEALNNAKVYSDNKLSDAIDGLNTKFVKPDALNDYLQISDFDTAKDAIEHQIEQKADAGGTETISEDLAQLKTDLPLTYYNKTEIDNKLGSVVSTDYSIQNFELRDRMLKLIQSPNGDTFEVELPSIVTGDTVTHDEFNTELAKYTKTSDFATITFNKGGVQIAEYTPNGTDTVVEVDAGAPQTYKGSPLMFKGTYVPNATYYDGTIEVNGVYEQDYVVYNSVYYVCSDYAAGSADGWATNPEDASYFTEMSMSDTQFINLLIANKASIKSLSSEEVVIADGATVVAGMTSSKAVDASSDLNGRVTTKGDTRIWAGELQKAGDLTSAPTTISDTGVIKSQNLSTGNTIEINPTEAAFTISVPEAVDDTYHLPTSDVRKKVFSIEAYVDPDSLATGAMVQMLGTNNIILDPTNLGVVVSEKYTDDALAGSRVYINHDKIEVVNASGSTVFEATAETSNGTASTKYVRIGESGKPQLEYGYDNGSMYLKANNLPAADPHNYGALWCNTDGILRVSQG